MRIMLVQRLKGDSKTKDAFRYHKINSTNKSISLFIKFSQNVKSLFLIFFYYLFWEQNFLEQINPSDTKSNTTNFVNSMVGKRIYINKLKVSSWKDC